MAAKVDRVLDTADGHRVFGTDVEEAFLRADRVAADHHAFDDVQRIGLQHAAVHERAGVSLVGVADDVARLFVSLAGHGPFLTSRKSAAAASAELGSRDFIDNPIGIARF